MIDFTVWDAVQATGSLCALTSIELAGRQSSKARMIAWYLVIAGHVIIISAGIVLGLEGLYVLNLGMITAGLRNIYRQKKQEKVIENAKKASNSRTPTKETPEAASS